MGYISISEANTYLGVSGQDTLVGVFIEMATNIVNETCGVTTFVSGTATNERYSYNGLGPYYLKNVPVNSITHINGSSVSYTEGTHYLLRGQRVEFAPSVSFTGDSIFNKVKFTYTYGYNPIPDKIKDATRIIVSELWSRRLTEGVNSWTQGDLSVSFDSISNKETKSKILMLLGKYILPKIKS